jgi:hypothetical protein
VLYYNYYYYSSSSSSSSSEVVFSIVQSHLCQDATSFEKPNAFEKAKWLVGMHFIFPKYFLMHSSLVFFSTFGANCSSMKAHHLYDLEKGNLMVTYLVLLFFSFFFPSLF